MKVCHLITRMIVGGAQENTLLSARGLLEDGRNFIKTRFDWRTTRTL